MSQISTHENRRKPSYLREKIRTTLLPTRLRDSLYLLAAFAFIFGVLTRYSSLSNLATLIMVLAIVGLLTTTGRIILMFIKGSRPSRDETRTRIPVSKIIGAVAVIVIAAPILIGVGYGSARAITPLSAEEIAQSQMRAEQRLQDEALRAEEKAQREADRQAEREARNEERAQREADRQAEREARNEERAQREAERQAERDRAAEERQNQRDQAAKDRESTREQQQKESAGDTQSSSPASTARADWEKSMRDDGWFVGIDGIWFRWATDFRCGYYNCIFGYIAVEETCMGGVAASAAIYRGNVSIGSDFKVTSALIKRGSTLAIAEVQFLDYSNNGDTFELTEIRCLRR